VKRFTAKNPGDSGGDGGGWSSRMLRLIQRFRKRVHEER